MMGAALQKFLSDPGSYPEATTEVECRETHISLVYLTDLWAYKFKKPLKLPFLDYLTLEARQQACMAEIELNRRFSHNVYVDIVTITRDEQGRLSFNGRGTIEDYAVRMRRIPDACLMDQRLLKHTFTSDDKERLVEHLVHCFHTAPHVSMEPAFYIQRLSQLIDENRSSLSELTLHMQQESLAWLAVCSKQSLFLRLYDFLLEERVSLKRIIEGHGDLRPEHVVLEDQVSLIDGIEFNRDFRILDQADELSFLCTECAAMGHASIGQELRQQVLNRLEDDVAPELLAFYESYRAVVRAKVNFIKAEQLPIEERHDILKLIERYRSIADGKLQAVMPPFTFIIAGAMGSGKTTVARALKRQLGAVHLESDQIRRQIFESDAKILAYGEGKYSEASRLKVYEKMREDMLNYLQRGMNVIVDSSLSEASYLECITEPLRSQSRPYLIVVCECSDEEALRRIKQRMQNNDSHSEATPELYIAQKQKGNWTFSGHPQCRVSTETPEEQQLQSIYQKAKHSFKTQNMI